MRVGKIAEFNQNRGDIGRLEDGESGESVGSAQQLHFRAELRGGGGIQPDVTVQPDTFTTAEQDFYRSLGTKLPVYRDVMTSYALELKATGEITDDRFRVTDAMVEELVRRLRDRDVNPSQESLSGGLSAITLELGYEIQRYVFGRESESLRRLADDPQVAAALDLLERARTVPELLAIAAAEAVASDDTD